MIKHRLNEKKNQKSINYKIQNDLKIKKININDVEIELMQQEYAFINVQ